jgi:hypothetical protein
MKPLAIWIVVVAAVFVGLAVLTNATRTTSRVFVVVDSSFPMSSVWADVEPELDRIDDRDHAEFALATEKRAIHGWQDELNLGSIPPIAPCTFEGIDAHPEFAEADDRILVTTPTSCDTSTLEEDDVWEIILLTP